MFFLLNQHSTAKRKPFYFKALWIIIRNLPRWRLKNLYPLLGYQISQDNGTTLQSIVFGTPKRIWETEYYFSEIKVIDKEKADGFNLVNNNFDSAGQFVKHVHFHVLPRKKGGKVPRVY